MTLTLLIFAFTYVAVAIGRVPGLRVDRTGATLVGAIAMLATERISPGAAWAAIGYDTLELLFGLMIVSASFAAAGFYAWAARRIASLEVRPSVLLAVLIGVSGALSCLLTNDVVVVAMTPLLVEITLERGLNPIPFLLGFCFASNNGAVATIIGSPQNVIIAQGLELSFGAFMGVAALPALLSLAATWGVLAWLYRGRWAAAGTAGRALARSAPAALNRRETAKAGVVTVCVVAAFVLTDWPRELVALGAAGVLLLNREIASTDMLGHVDGDLLILLFGLFVVNAAFALTPVPAALLGDLRAVGIDLQQPLWLYLATALLSDIVGNSPAAMLVVPYVGTGQPAATGAAMALGSGFASNLVVFGSLAGIIVVAQADRCGVRISAGEFSRAGVPVTIASMLLGAAWIAAVS